MYVGLPNLGLNSLQQTGPALDLNFLGGTVDPRITYSGGTNGTRVDSTGTIVAATCPRFDYDPVTRAAKGLLIEEARTNLALRSAEFDNAAWTKFQSASVANQTTSPDGTVSADVLKEDNTAAGTHVMFQDIATAANATVSYTVYAKAKERSKIRLVLTDTGANDIRSDFNLLTGVTANTVIDGTGTVPVADITAVGTGWYRCRLSGIPAAAGVAVRATIYLLDNAYGLVYNGDGASGVYLWGAQVEAGAFATSYIPTVAAAVTRTADSAVMTGSDFSSWYRQDEGTFITIGTDGPNHVAGQFPRTIAINDGTANNYMQMVIAGGGDVLRLETKVGGVQQIAGLVAKTGYTGQLINSGFAYSLNNTNVVADGVMAVANVANTIPTVTQLSIGSDSSGSQLSGHIKRLRYYNRRLPDTTLQVITA